MNGFHTPASFSTDDWVRVIALLMVLSLVIGNIATRRSRIPRTAWPVLLWMALIWAGIIAVAALAFQHFRPGGM